MAYQVSWSPEAVEDIEKIASYIEKDSPSYAQAVSEQIITASRQLNQSPLIGRIVAVPLTLHCHAGHDPASSKSLKTLDSG